MSAGRRRSLLLLGAAAGTAWFVLAGLPLAARAWTIVLLVALPAWTYRQAAALHDIETLPRIPVYLSSILGLVLLAGVTAAVAFATDFEPASLGLTRLPAATAANWTMITTAAALLYALLCRAIGMRETPTTLRLLPHTRAEKLGFAAVSVAAGVFEEFVYRGFLIAAIALATGFTPLALLVAAAAFGLVHGYQAPAGILRATALGLILTLPLLATGSLLPGVIAHAAYDMIMGIVLADRLRE